MQVYTVDADSTDGQSLVPALDLMPDGRNDPRLNVCPQPVEGWTPPPLVHYSGKRKLDLDFWDYGQGLAFAVSNRVAETLSDASWCALRPFTAQVFDPKGRPVGEVNRILMATTRVLDAVDRSLTRFKPYGHEVLDFDQPGAIVLRQDELAPSGLFLLRSGNSFRLFCAEQPGRQEESFRSLCLQQGWTGLRFKPV